MRGREECVRGKGECEGEGRNVRGREECVRGEGGVCGGRGRSV